MIGSAVVSLPWAFQQSGLLLGCLISFCSFFVSYYTCNLVVHCARKDTDFSDTVRRYYGKCAVLFILFINSDALYRRLWVLPWVYNVGNAPLRSADRLLRDLNTTAIPADARGLRLDLRKQPCLPDGAHSESVLAKLLRPRPLLLPLTDLQQEGLEHLHEGGLHRRHLRLHAHHLHRLDWWYGLHQY